MATLSQEQAIRQISKLKKPENMYQPSWLMMQALLRELIRHQPDCRPGLQYLADRLHTSLSATHRLVVKAEALELISREEIKIPGSRWNGHRYTLTFLADSVPTFLSASGSKEEPSPTGRVSLTSSETVRFAPEAPGRTLAKRRLTRCSRSRKTNRYDGVCAVCTHPVKAFDGFLHGPLPRHRECDTGVPDWKHLREYLMSKFRETYGNPDHWGDSFGDDPEASLPTYSPPPAKPQARLARYFETRWNEALVKRKEWRGMYRGIDTGAAIGYLRAKMLDAGYNEEHITAMIDEFFEDLLSPEGDLMMKDGQTCWQLFTGWWGRNPVPDPVPIRRQRERLDALNEAVADMIKATAKPAPPPPVRRVLTRP